MLDIFYPRGIRNNNPGNIRLGHESLPWMGQRTVQADRDFCEFIDPVFGLRALMRVLISYRYKHDLKSVEQIIRRFAPPYENATDNYIFQVARALQVKRTDELDVSAEPVLRALAAAIVRQENGRPPAGRPENWYAPDMYGRAAALALDFKERKPS